MESLFSLFNLGDIGEPMEKVINNVVNKIAAALEWGVLPKGIKPSIIEANKSLIEEIAKREDIPVIERAVVINNYKKLIREYKNQVNVIENALTYLKPNVSAQEVKDDWIVYFFERCKIITEKDVVEIWAKVLAGEFNVPGTYTKQFLHTLSIMDGDMAKRFQKLRSSCFYVPPNLYMMVYRTNGSDIRNNDKYKEINLVYKDFRELDNLGLIKYRYPNFYTIKNSHKDIFYGQKRIKLNTDKSLIATGNVSLTDMGKQLCRISPVEYDERVFEICMETWKQLGYNPSVEIVQE